MISQKPLKGPNKVIYDVLSESDKPLAAYQILECVKTRGITGPPTVYRALNKLIKLGMAHRIASTHSYVMCRYGQEHKNESVVFAVCYLCDNVQEVADKSVYSALENIIANNGFKTRSEIVEIIGTCRGCREYKVKI